MPAWSAPGWRTLPIRQLVGPDIHHMRPCRCNRLDWSMVAWINVRRKWREPQREILQSWTHLCVHMMDLRCGSTTSNSGYLLTNAGAPACVFPEIYQFYPTGETVIGIQGRAGLFVDAIGIICGAFAKAAPSRPEPTPIILGAAISRVEKWTIKNPL